MELVVGRVIKSHGIRGELVVEVRTDSPEERFAPGSTLTGKIGKGPTTTSRDIVVKAARDHSGRLLVQLVGVDSRNDADALRGMLFVVDSAELPEPADPDEYYDHQLVGLHAVTTDGTAMGEVVDVVHTPGGELLSLRLPDGVDALVPFVTAIVPEVSLADRRIVIDPPDGLFDLDAK